MDKKKPLISMIDWRYRVATTLAQDWTDPETGTFHEKGSPITVDTFVKHNNRRIRLGDPSAVALFLNHSHRIYEQALEIHPFLTKQPPGSKRDQSEIVYDYLELIMGAIIFAYTALESFANEEIPENYVYKREEQQKTNGIFVVRHHQKDWVERNVSLDEKLATILPEVLNKPSPKGLKIWEEFVYLRRFRNRIIHLKSNDRARSQGHNLFPNSIWSELLAPNQQNYPLVAKSMILHFKEEFSVHWLKYCPF